MKKFVTICLVLSILIVIGEYMNQSKKANQLSMIMQSVFQRVEKEKDITLGEVMEELTQQLEQVVKVQGQAYKIK
jgi:uncharacterized protein YqeY